MASKMSNSKMICAVMALTIIPTLLLPNLGYSADFKKVGESIVAQEQLVAALANEKDTFSQSLIEPLVQLAKLQRSANRYRDAQQTIGQALQTTRITHGLYDETQLPLLRFDIETTVALTDWNSARDKLDHYTWLLTDHIEQPVGSIVESILWLVSIHEQGVYAATESDRVWHITRASALSRALVSLTQENQLQETLPHVQFLYELTKMNFIEAKAILAGGSTSYHLREAHALISNVESRANSQRRLYNSGLNTLYNIKAIMHDSDNFNEEALSLVDLRIADWKVLFGKADDIAETYRPVIAALNQAGVSDESISELFRHPAPLPRANITLSVAEEIYNITDNSSFSETNNSIRLSVFEATSDIPGVLLEEEPHSITTLIQGDWGGVVSEVLLDTSAEATIKNSGFRTKSRVTPKKTKLLASFGLEDKTLKNVQARITALSFRPAFVDGVPVESTLTLDYRFRDAIWSDNERLLTLQ